MKSCEAIAALLPLSAADLLEAAEERMVRRHVRECAACAARLESLGGIAAALSSLPAPAPPIDLSLRTQALVAAELTAAADRRQGGLLALAGVALGWISWFALWDFYRVLTGGIATVLRPEWPGPWAWLALSTLMGFVAAPVAAALLRAQRGERSIL
jgi:anti-sigma factor RsiW